MTLQSLTEQTTEGGERSTPLEKTLAILEFVAERGGATAREVSEGLGYPVPSVYRLAKALVQAGYLVHLKDKSLFELGYKPHQLAVSLHRQIGVPAPVKAAIAEMHRRVSMAAYFAVYRGADVVVAYIVDSPEHPRLTPLSFGFHEAAHATAFGKIMLAGMNLPQRNQYLAVHGMPPLQESTMTDVQELSDHLETVMIDGIAWEHEEFVPGKTCAAVGVRNGAGIVIGAVAVSAETEFMLGREAQVETSLRETANRVSKYFRAGVDR